MTEILEVIERLAKSQGFYERLYNRIMQLKQNDPEKYEEYSKLLEEQKFKDSIDVIMHYEALPTFTVKQLVTSIKHTT